MAGEATPTTPAQSPSTPASAPAQGSTPSSPAGPGGAQAPTTPVAPPAGAPAAPATPTDQPAAPSAPPVSPSPQTYPPKAPDPAAPGQQAPSGETSAKPADDPAAGKTDPQSAAGKPAVPEKYELKLPKDSPLEAKATERIAAEAKAQGLSNEQAQALLDRENAAVSAYATRQQEQYKQTVEGWRQAASQDPEIGGLLFKENIELAHRVVKRFGSDAFIKEIDKGFGNHPELVRTFARIGRQMKEDSLVMPGAQSGESRSVEEVLYPKTTKQE